MKQDVLSTYCYRGEFREIKRLIQLEPDTTELTPLIIYTACFGTQKHLFDCYGNRINLSDEKCKEQLELIMWLLEIKPELKNVEYNYITSAANSSNLSLVKWLIANVAFKSRDISGAFEIACYRGFFEMAKWLYELYDKSNFLSTCAIFRMTCSMVDDDYRVLEWLVEMFPKLKDLKPTVYEDAVKKGNTRLAEWLMSIQPAST